MPNEHEIRENTMRPTDSGRCGAFTGVENDSGHHLCALDKGHEGLHECDVCDIVWLDSAVKPIVTKNTYRVDEQLLTDLLAAVAFLYYDSIQPAVLAQLNAPSPKLLDAMSLAVGVRRGEVVR